MLPRPRASRVCFGSGRLDRVGHGTDESRGRVQRLRSLQTDATRFGDLFCLDVEVVKYFDVIADESQRRHQDASISFLRKLRNDIFKGGSEPGPRACARALVGEGPIDLAEPIRENTRVFLKFVVVRIALLENP